MRVYIASRYKEHEKNRKIYDALINANIDAFLPETIDIFAITDEEKLTVAEICYDEILKCDVVLFVCSFGQSVSCEYGYTVAIRRLLNKKNKIVVLNSDIENEAMLWPYVDKTVENISQLIEYLKTI